MLIDKLNTIFEGWIREYRFDSNRKFRFDFANPKLKIAIEIEGGIWTGGGHIRGKGYTKDMEKYNLAIINGWKVLRYESENNENIEKDIKKVIENGNRT